MKRKILMACILISMATFAYGQDTTASINSTWRLYASDTGLTFKKIVGICDSQFSIAGYPVFPGAAKNKDDEPRENDELEDGSPFVEYLRWKNFWSTRLDVLTGKLHDFGAAAKSMFSSGNGSSQGPSALAANCAGTSDLQNAMLSLAGVHGWQFIGPQNIKMVDVPVDQHLGQINSIVVNPANADEVYATDDWGGLWKTNNATLAPSNTWTCLTQNGAISSISGIGVRDVYVDFTTTPHHIFCKLGVAHSLCVGNDEHTVGALYSLDDGVTFNTLYFPVGFAYWYDHILDMKYWPGNAFSPTKYIFVTTQYEILRYDITNPAAVTLSGVMVDVRPSIVPTDAQSQRFRGFTEMNFEPSDPTNMYVATASNAGEPFAATAGLYKVKNCNTCTGCTLEGINMTSSDYLCGKGAFTDPAFPYYQWYSAGWTYGGGNIQCNPGSYGSGTKSVEMDVDGSYFDHVIYNVSFTLVLPPLTEVDVVLKDVNSGNIYVADWGTGLTPTVSSSYPVNIPVGGGYSYSGATYAGKYINNDPVSSHSVVVSGGVAAYHFVDRLEFGASSLSGYSGGNITLSNLSVVQVYQDVISNLCTTPAAGNNLYCFTSLLYQLPSVYQVQKIFDPGTGSYPTTSFNCFAAEQHSHLCLSSVNPNIMYEGSQTGGGLWKLNMATGGTTSDVTELLTLHVDVRCIVTQPNVGHTDDVLYVGEDGGLGRGLFSGAWQSLNGTGLNTSLDYSIGSSIHSGEVGLAATDNGILTSNEKDFSTWQYKYVGDGGEAKYGKRFTTRNVRFEGWSYASGFAGLTPTNLGGSPAVDLSSLPPTTVNNLSLSKLVSTYNNEYFCSNSGGTNIFDVTTLSGAGTTASPFVLGYQSLTTDPSFLHELIQAVAPDMYDPNYVAAYVHTAPWDQGYFEFCTNASAATPTWTVVSNNPAVNSGATNWMSLICMAVDPRPHTLAGKRLWAGAGGYLMPWETNRVFQSVDGGNTWADMSYGLPGCPINALEYDEQSHYLFAGTDQGVYAFNVDGQTGNSPSNPWLCYSLNLPNSFITGLDINRCTGKLYASTYGRGAYEADLPPDYNWNGTFTSGGSMGMSDFCDVDVITGLVSSPTFWTEDKDEMRTVYIGPGNALVIQNCTINMGRNKNIIVDVGGSLIIDGATITNSCGSMWGTISVLGDPSVAQDLTHVGDPVTTSSVPYCNQGFLKLMKYTGYPNRDVVLENSYTAILLGAQYYDGGDWGDYAAGQEGGLLNADHATFHNCMMGVLIGAYGMVTSSYMSDCHFLGDAPLQNAHFVDHSLGYARPYSMQTGVDNIGTWGMSFWNDTFETVNNPSIGFTPDLDLCGEGYSGYNSYTEFHTCHFNNLTRGILSTSTYSPDAIHVYDCIMNGCWRSISNDGGGNFICYDNQIQDATSMTMLADMGIYANTTDFHISENSVTAPISGGGTNDGIVATGNSGNTLYRNTINRFTYGVEGILDDVDGLFQVKCNTFNDCPQALNFWPTAGTTLPPDQGSCADPAGNRFNFMPSCYTCAQIVNWITYYGSPATFNYSTYLSDPYKLYPAMLSYVNPYPCTIDCTDFNACCPAEPATYYRIAGHGTGSGPKSTGTDATGGKTISFSDATAGLATSDQQILGLQAKLNAGNAPELYSVISNRKNSSARVKNALMQAGPYLSDAVLMQSIDRTPALEYSDLKHVVLNNSNLNQTVVSELTATNPTLASDTDLANTQNFQSARQLAQDSLNNYYSQRSEYISALSRYYGSVQDWLSAAQLHSSHRQFEEAFGYYLKAKDFSDAQNMIDSIPDAMLAELMTIHLNHVQIGKSPDSLSVNDSTTLAGMSLNRTTHAGELAYIWYTHAFGLPFFENMPKDSAFHKSMTQQPASVDSPKAFHGTTNLINGKPTVSIFPNPASNMVTVSVNNGTWGAGCEVTVSDVYGRSITKLYPLAGSSSLKVNTQSLIGGVYIFTVHLSDGTLFTSKVVIRKE